MRIATKSSKINISEENKTKIISENLSKHLKQNDILFDSIKNHKSLQSNEKIKKIGILIKKIEKND